MLSANCFTEIEYSLSKTQQSDNQMASKLINLFSLNREKSNPSDTPIYPNTKLIELYPYLFIFKQKYE